MRRLNRKAFTLVELVIVIAVISVLAAVLIPTFSGIIRSANKSADEQIAASINIGLAMADKIENEQDLAKAIDDTFAEGTYEKLAPKSAQYGYHYWYDAQSNTVVLKSYNEIVALNESEQRSAKVESKKSGTVALAAVTVAKNEGFADSEKNNFRMFGNYFILDNGGSVIGEALNALKTGVDVAQKVEELTKVQGSSDNKEMADALVNKLNTVAIISDSMTYVRDPDSVTNIYFAPGIETIPTYDKDYIAKADNITDDIIIPDSVKTVKENALIFDTAGIVTIKTSLTTADDIAGVFQANSTNAIIVGASNVEYTINGGTVSGSDGSTGDLSYGNPVASFEIVTPNDTDDYKTISGNIYVAYNYTGTIQLGVGSFVGVNKGAVSSEAVTWSSNNEHVSISEDGKISILGLPDLDECVANITATAVAGDASKTITVNIVRPSNVEFTFANGNYDMTVDEDAPVEKITITFDGSTFDFAFTDFYEDINISGMVDCDTNFVVTAGAGSLFTITDNVLKFVDDVKFVDEEGNPITQQFTVKIGTALDKTFEVSVNDISAAEFDLKTPFKDPKFLYRVGNGNTVNLGHFFNGTTSVVPATLTIVDFANTGLSAKVNGEASANGTWSIDVSTEAWKSTSIQFTGTGVAEINIGGVSTKFEIVDGLNATSYSDFKSGNNIVMLARIEMEDNEDRFTFTNTTLYGNGFTFDVTKGNYIAVRYEDNYSALSENYRILLNNGTLDNVRIEGNPFDGFSAVAREPENICNVLSIGNDKIINCYITNCAAPVRVKGNSLEVVNTTLVGGSIANLDIREGNLTLDNVTTINQKSVNGTAASEGAVGFGIIVWYEGVAKANITIKNKLTQYNCMSESDFESIPLEFNGVNLSSTVTNLIFHSSNSGTSKFIKDVNGVKWINTGIFSMNAAVGSENIINSEFDDKSLYSGAPVSASYLGQSFSGYLYTVDAENVVLVNPTEDYVSAGQGLIYPSFSVDNSKNAENKVEGSNVYCYYENGTIYISFDDGGSKTLDLDGLCKAMKGLSTLTVTNIYLDGNPVDASSVNFDSKGDHVLTFVFDDPYNYNLNGSSIVIQHTKSVNISVAEVEPEAKNAEFYFFGDTNYPAKPILIGNTTYLTLDINEATDVASTNGSQYMVLNDGKRVYKTTISGTTIYYPVIDLVMSDGKTSHTSGWYAYFYVFSGAITIVDYDASGNKITYNASTTTMPAGLSVNNPATAFKYGSATSAAETPAVKNNVLCYSSAKIEANRAEQTPNAMYTYKDNTGANYTYYVGYYAPAQSYSSICVTPDTLVTLADGTQKEIQYVTYEDKLLVWNFYTGKYDVIGASIVMNHGYNQYTVVTLNFADGTTVNTINGHGFFDVETNKYVILNEENVADYIGHEFVKVDGDGYSTTKLVNYSISEEYTESWSILTAEHYNCILEGMWTLTPAEVEGSPDYLMPFEIKDMKYDEEAMKADIEKYGLYTYEEFADLITIEQFEALGLATFKVSVGKGYITYEDILFLIDLHC